MDIKFYRVRSFKISFSDLKSSKGNESHKNQNFLNVQHPKALPLEKI